MKWFERIAVVLCLVCVLSVGQARYILPAIMSATVFSSTYDTATPLGSDAPSSIDDQIRLTKAAIQERQNVDHYWPLSGTQVSDADAGEHRKVLFHAPIAATPTVAASHGDLRIKDVLAKAELTWTDEDEQELILTDAGKLNVVEADLLGTVTNNTYFTAIDNAGTGTVDLIKGNTSDVAVLPDASEMASSAAPTSDADIANKKYVDDNIGSANWNPTAMTGGNDSNGSVTSPNGLITKWGTQAISGTYGTVVFASSFPSACFQAIVCGGNSINGTTNTIQVYSIAAGGFSWHSGAASTLTPMHWIAIGR